MEHQPPFPERDRDSRPILIGRPSPHDGIGRALRQAYEADMSTLPSDMERLLSQLCTPHNGRSMDK